MDRGSNAISTDEEVITGANGWMMLIVALIAAAVAFGLVATPGSPVKFIGGVGLLVVAAFCVREVVRR